MSEHRKDLVAHCGGAPSAVQRALIERAVALYLRLHLMDRETLRSAGMTERNGREYLAWNNAYGRTVRQLGIKAVAVKATTLSEHVAARQAAKEASAT
jgi:hypothetical protein